MWIIDCASGALDLYGDVGNLHGPGKLLGDLKAFAGVFSDSRNRLFGIVRYAATQTILSEDPA